MRLVVDLQALQSISATRGIGRYALELTIALARAPRGHEVWATFNSTLTMPPPHLMDRIDRAIPASNIHFWRSPPGTAGCLPGTDWRRTAATRMRWEFLQSLAPDVVLSASIFEGVIDDQITLLPPLHGGPVRAAIFYDAIPLIHADRYLTDPLMRTVFDARYDVLRKMDLLLAISRSSRREAIDHVGLDPDRVACIMAGVDEAFCPGQVTAADRARLYRQYNLPDDFLLFVGGGETRKNAVGLVRAFVSLPQPLRQRYPLAIASFIAQQEQDEFRRIAEAEGADPRDIIVTGYVAETDLPLLYRACSLFVYPSLHEGFGLPVLEAMACGAPAIGSNTTSVPEVIGRTDAMFDPANPASIAERMSAVLTDPALRRSLREYGPQRAAGLTWDACAGRAWDALEATAEAAKGRPGRSLARKKPSLLFTSPLPPAASGIADYSAELLPALAEHYDITVMPVFAAHDRAMPSDPSRVADVALLGYPSIDPLAFSRRRLDFDRVVHQVGASTFHAFQIDGVLRQAPGFVVLHEVFLGALLIHLDQYSPAGGRLAAAMAESHGAAGLHDMAGGDLWEAVRKWPCSLAVAAGGTGCLVHSHYAREMVARYYGEEVAAGCAVVQHHRRSLAHVDKAAARARLGLDPDAEIVCSFGIVAEVKQPYSAIGAFARTRLSRRNGSRLVFVGSDEMAPHVVRIPDFARSVAIHGRVVVTGRVDRDVYRDWLAAADVVLQLRASSRGEASGAVLDALAAGCATIVNDHGAMAELPDDVALHLPGNYAETDLAAAIDALAGQEPHRRMLGERARRYIATERSPARTAQRYCEAIERAYAVSPRAAGLRLMRQVAEDTVGLTPNPSDVDAVLAAAAATLSKFGAVWAPPAGGFQRT